MSWEPRVTKPQEPFLAVDRLSKRYGETRAIDDMSLTIPRGEFLTLLGPSGSGKTTLLMAIAGFVTPSGGSIRLDGREIAGLPPEKRDLGVVFQGYALFPHMTVAENIAFPLEVRRLPRPEITKLVAGALETVQLGPLAGRKPAELSGGQQQRVAIARSLALQPQVMLFDEVTSALDPELTAEVLGVMESLAQRGMTMISVTHEMGFARRVADLVVFMHKGKVWEIGPTQELFANPRTAEFRQFVGSEL